MFRNPLTDVIVVLVVVLLIFGPKRLPLLGRSLGQGMREFKESITGENKDQEEERPALTSGQAAAPAPTAAPAQTPVEAAPAQAAPAEAAPVEPVPTAPERDTADVAASESRS